MNTGRDIARTHTATKRKSGSCRFATYYKLEWFDASLSVWRPLQKSFGTIALANKAKSAGKAWRVFEVSENGRRVLQ
jgi:hypothetical protein